MSASIAAVSVGWIVWFGVTAWRFRPPTVVRDPRGVVPAAADDGRHRLLAVGRVVAERVPALATVDHRVLTACVIATPVLLVVTGPIGVALPLGVVGWFRALGRREASRRRDAFVDELADMVEMMRVATSSGCNAPASIAAARRHAPAGRCAGFDRIVGSLQRGRSLEAALDDWAGHHGPPADDLAALVRSADRSGVAIGGGLQRLAAELRRRRRVEAETRARRLPVTMLAPLVICVLPAFGLITVVPMIAVGIAGLSP